MDYRSLKTIGLVFLVVISATLILKGVHTALAEESPPRIVLDAASDIQANQERIEELRPLVAEFEALKTDNAVQVGRMRAFCYDFDWSKQKPVRLDGCDPLL